MAKGKRRKSLGPEESVATGGKEPPHAAAAPLPEDRFSFAEYLVAVLIFWAFCGLTFLVTWLWTGETIGMPFFFLALCVGFTVVAVFSWLHDLLYRDEEPEQEPSA